MRESPRSRLLEPPVKSSACSLLDGAFSICSINRHEYRAGDTLMRWSGKQAHRIELVDGPCWTLFITVKSCPKTTGTGVGERVGTG
jgi:hypothetical protein